MASEEMDIDIKEARDSFLHHNFDEKIFEIDPKVTVEYARMCGETASRFIDPDDPDFQAPPTYVACLSGGRSLPENYPRFGIGMDAGKGVECLAPIRPPAKLTGRTHIHDIYTKTGRSGRMVFTVSRIEFYTEKGEHVANADSRMVMRERS